MMWQMWTGEYIVASLLLLTDDIPAFGIMLGFAVSVAFENVTFLGEFSPWRWMLGSTAIPPLVVMVQVYFCPESPRWYMDKGKYDQAFHAFSRLRKHKIQAARDMYYAYKMLEVEAVQREGKNLWKEFFAVKRNRRAAQSAFFVMFMQQFCGVSTSPPFHLFLGILILPNISQVNVVAYYSTAIFRQAGFSSTNALLVSFGTGVTNWLFAIPAIYSEYS